MHLFTPAFLTLDLVVGGSGSSGCSSLGMVFGGVVVMSVAVRGNGSSGCGR